MVEYIDGSIVAQMGITGYEDPDLLCPFLSTTAPSKPTSSRSLQKGSSHFFPPDPERFPCLKLAYQSIEIGETMPAILNAANEVAVNAFLEGSLKFTEIPLLLQRVMEEHEVKSVHTIEDILKADHWARERAKAILRREKIVLTTIFSTVIVLGILVFVHELGHFLLAKKLGVGVLTFSLGFGPKLIGRKFGETQYQISVFPLGGFVKLIGENPEEEVKEEDRCRSFSFAPDMETGLDHRLLVPSSISFLLSDLLSHQYLCRHSSSSILEDRRSQPGSPR